MADNLKCESKDPRDKNYSIVLFPFLKTSLPVRIGSFLFRSNDDLNGITDEQAKSVVEISKILFLRDNQRIKKATYSIIDRIDLEYMRNTAKLDELGEIENFIAYLYASPRHEFNDLLLTPEHANTLVLTPNRVMTALLRDSYNVVELDETSNSETESIEEIDGYDGLLGLRHHLWVAPGSRIYGTIPRSVLNISQDLYLDVDRSWGRADYRYLIELLSERNFENDQRDRVFTAVRWFNRANSEHRDEAESFVCLSVALETLFRLPYDEKKDRLVDSISLLLGRVPRLKDWANQFYEARSNVVHEGNVKQISYIPDSKKRKKTNKVEYQSLLAYGREVFQLCLGTILTGAKLSSDADLESKFITNSERFETVCRKMSDESVPPSKRLKQLDSLAQKIHRYQWVPDTGLNRDEMLGACRASAKVVLDSGTEIVEELHISLCAMISVPKDENQIKRLDALKLIVEVINKNNFTESTELQGLITLVRTTWQYLFRYYFAIKRESSD